MDESEQEDRLAKMLARQQQTGVIRSATAELPERNWESV